MDNPERMIEVYVVNRERNQSVGDGFTLQFNGYDSVTWDGRGYFRQWAETIVPLNKDPKDENYWGLDCRNFPTLTSMIKMIDDRTGPYGPNQPWFYAKITEDEFVALLKADMEGVQIEETVK